MIDFVTQMFSRLKARAPNHRTFLLDHVPMGQDHASDEEDGEDKQFKKESKVQYKEDHFVGDRHAS